MASPIFPLSLVQNVHKVYHFASATTRSFWVLVFAEILKPCSDERSLEADGAVTDMCRILAGNE